MARDQHLLKGNFIVNLFSGCFKCFKCRNVLNVLNAFKGNFIVNFLTDCLYECFECFKCFWKAISLWISLLIVCRNVLSVLNAFERSFHCQSLYWLFIGLFTLNVPILSRTAAEAAKNILFNFTWSKTSESLIPCKII